jgi:hypothetical protein
LRLSESFLNHLENHAKGRRNTKKIVVSNIFELIHPNPSASLNHNHSTAWAAGAMKMDTMPTTMAAVMKTD